MRARDIILILVILVIGLVGFADADIYKWKDENGRTHFTDDPTKVPEAFRKNPLIKDPKKLEIRKSKPLDKAVGLKNFDQPVEKEEDKQKALTEAQRSTAEAAVSFLNSDIPRYEKYYSGPANRSKFRFLQIAVGEAATQKQTLWDNVYSYDLPLFKEIAEFLKSSIAADEKTQKIVPNKFTTLGQTQLLMNRLKSETEQETQLLKKLTAALSVKPEKVEPVGESPPPVEKPKPSPLSRETSESLDQPAKSPESGEVKQTVKNEKPNFGQDVETYKKLLKVAEEARASQLKKISKLKDLEYKPKSWTTEDSLEEVIAGLEDRVKISDQKIRRYKGKIEELSVQD